MPHDRTKNEQSLRPPFSYTVYHRSVSGPPPLNVVAGIIVFLEIVAVEPLAV